MLPPAPSLDAKPTIRFNVRLHATPIARAAVHPGRVAQLVEQGIENPRVGGSIPSPATIRFNDLAHSTRVGFFVV